MKIIDAILLADASADNDIEQAVKLQWLSALDGKLAEEVCNKHVDTAVDFRGYDETTDMKETELLVPDPWSELYPDYLEMRIYLLQKEIDRYNNAAMVYAESLRQWVNWFNKRHMPVSYGALRF